MTPDDAAWSAAARAALRADGRDADAPLSRVRVKAGEVVSYASGSAFVKVFIGPNSAETSGRAHAGQLRAAGVLLDGAPVSPRPGPLTGQAFAMDRLAARPLDQVLRSPFAPRRRLLIQAGRAVHAVQGKGEDRAGFGGWPSRRLSKATQGISATLWPGAPAQIDATAAALWSERDTLTPIGTGHGDCHPGNLLVDASGRLHVIDFETVQRRPIIGDIANFLISLAAHTPGWRTGTRSALGLSRRDSDAFLSAFPELRDQQDQQDLLALHMLRFALRRASRLLNADGTLPRGSARRRLSRLEAVANRLSERLFGDLRPE